MKYSFIIGLSIILFSCMPEEDLPVRNLGKTKEYFIECYCKPGEIFTLSAAHVFPISENISVDFSADMDIYIQADENIKLFHSLFTLPGSDFIYNYGNNKRLTSFGVDTLYLTIHTKDNQRITAHTIVPDEIKIYKYKITQEEVSIQFFTSPYHDQNYYIYSVEFYNHDSIVKNDIVYLDLSDYERECIIEKNIKNCPYPNIQKIALYLKRITQDNYEYQLSLQGANSANQSSITTPVPLKGNLEGALGIFTCYTEDIKIINLQ